MTGREALLRVHYQPDTRERIPPNRRDNHLAMTDSLIHLGQERRGARRSAVEYVKSEIEHYCEHKKTGAYRTSIRPGLGVRYKLLFGYMQGVGLYVVAGTRATGAATRRSRVGIGKESDDTAEYASDFAIDRAIIDL